LSPLLANIALSAIEERYQRHVWPRRAPTLLTDPDAIIKRAIKAREYDRRCGRTIAFPVRYADDFIILVSAPPGPDQERRAMDVALQEKAALAALLREELGLELSEQKTLVTAVTKPMLFLGHHVFVRPHLSHGKLVSTTVIPRDRSQRLRRLIKRTFAVNTTEQSLWKRLRYLNPKLRGWSNFYRHAWGAKRVFDRLDHYVWWTIRRWLKKKHPRRSKRALVARYGARGPLGGVRWQDGGERPFAMAKTRVEPFRLAWLKPANFAEPSAESPVRTERRTPGSGTGAP
jgi:hypothetical protein